MLLLTLILACGDKSEEDTATETVEDTAIVEDEDTSSETETEDTAEAQ
jgi:hypothetical protein